MADGIEGVHLESVRLGSIERPEANPLADGLLRLMREEAAKPGFRDGARADLEALRVALPPELREALGDMFADEGLALRVAGYAAFCDRHGPLPFVTDDVLEAFDDRRADAALRMAGEMGMRGQVVFFTHHDHIVALARKAMPSVSVVPMPRQAR